MEDCLGRVNSRENTEQVCIIHVVISRMKLGLLAYSEGFTSPHDDFGLDAN